MAKERQAPHKALIDSLVIAFRNVACDSVSSEKHAICFALCFLAMNTEFTPEEAAEILKRMEDLAFILAPLFHAKIASAHEELVADLRSRSK